MEFIKKEKDKNVESTRGYSYATPLCDIYENDSEYRIIFDMPGIEKDDININIEKDILSITAESKKSPDEKYILINEEMGFAGYKRSFNLNRIIDSEKVNAVMDRGTLVLTCPRKKNKKQRK